MSSHRTTKHLRGNAKSITKEISGYLIEKVPHVTIVNDNGDVTVGLSSFDAEYKHEQIDLIIELLQNAKVQSVAE